MAEYEAVIGMEVHAQLLTRSKMFCGCDADVFGAGPNTHVCPVCLGMPGVLPVINRSALEQAIMVGLALRCEMAKTAVFSRKNYFYPDLPKAYQISMYDFPLAEHGWVDVEVQEQGTPEPVLRRIGITRVHLEEDTAKSAHAGDRSLVDFNRSGLPLLEIVTEPDIRTPEEARQYLVKLRAILRYLGVSTGDMEKGAMRCEANVSLRPAGTETLGTKVEVKNLNSFRSVKQALQYEMKRQSGLLDQGEAVRQVTMGWDERRGRTVEQRSKETSDDYRYFPEPDLPPIRILAPCLEKIRASLPELPDEVQDRFVSDYGLGRADASVLAEDRDVAEYFEAAVTAGKALGVPPRTVGNWVSGELFRLLKAHEAGIDEAEVTPDGLAELLALVEGSKITSNTGKKVLAMMHSTGKTAPAIIEEEGLAQVSDKDALAATAQEIIGANPEQVAKYRDGKVSLLSWFVGQVMRATRGRANPQVATSLLRKMLDD